MATKHGTDRFHDRHSAPEPTADRRSAKTKELETKAESRQNNEAAEQETALEERLKEIRSKPEIQINTLRHHIRRLYGLVGLGRLPDDIAIEFDLDVAEGDLEALEEQKTQPEVIREAGEGPAPKLETNPGAILNQQIANATMNYRGNRKTPKAARKDDAAKPEVDPRTGRPMT